MNDVTLSHEIVRALTALSLDDEDFTELFGVVVDEHGDQHWVSRDDYMRSVWAAFTDMVALTATQPR